jgi:hypothetical protein
MTPHLLVIQMSKMLRNLDGFLTKATAYAEARKYDTAVLVQTRLIPDMFPFVRQIQSACDSAKFAASRVSGKDAPSHPDTETTFAELSARIGKVVEYLGTFTAADFENVDGRTISLPRWEGKSMTVIDYLVEHAIPNFYFHVTTSYAILRAAGVDVGKRDFLGTMTMKAPA